MMCMCPPHPLTKQFTLTCIDSKAEPKCIENSDHLVGFNIQPSYGHDEGKSAKKNLHYPVRRGLDVKEEEQNN